MRSTHNTGGLSEASWCQRRRMVVTRILLVGLVASLLAVPATGAGAAPSLLSLGAPAEASSVENPDYTPPAGAFDGDGGTRWSSQWTDAEWIQVDLGQQATLDRVELDWESAYASSYVIEAAPTATGPWSVVQTVTDGRGGSEVVPVTGEGRFVRMRGIQRVNGYGYSLWEFRVFGLVGTSDPDDPIDPGGTVNPGHPNEPGPFTAPSVVRVTGGNGSWELQVNDKPYTVKGFTWGPAFSAADQYMPGLVDIGANTIRTWGTGTDTLQLLDSAAAHGIRVINGFWLLPGGGPGSGGCIEYTNDASYKDTTKAEILDWVTTYKDHPGILMWNVGNESLLGLQNCFSGTKLEAERNAYAAFVNDVAAGIHAIDPNHPVTSTDAWTGSWPYYQANAPELDLLAVNAYGDVCSIRQTWIDGGYDRPYIVTEGGASGEWEVPDDINGVPDEPTDLQKAQAYVDSWRCIIEHDNVGLGATFFHYGIEGDFGGVWFNIIPGGNKRLGYYSIGQAWGGNPGSNTPAEITSMTIPGSTDIVAGSTFDIGLDASDPDGDDLNYVAFFNSKYIDGAGGLAFVESTQVDATTFRVTAPQKLGVWKAYIFVEDGHGNTSVETKSFRVVPPPVSGTNVALNKPADASSFQTWGANYSPGQAFDGDVTTRWSSEWTPQAWIQVDLESTTSFDHVRLVWETAYATSYEVQVSEDGSNWSTIHTVQGGDGGVDDFDLNGTGRYVRLNLTGRGTDWGYSLHEVGLYQSN